MMKTCALLALTLPLLASAGGLKGSKQRKLQDIDLGEILGIGCFSEVSTVQVESQGPVAMKDLQVGDKILTANNEYQPVYSFGHWQPMTMGTFLQIRTEEGATLEMTGEHLVYAAADEDYPVRADSLRVGDVLKGSEQQSTTHTVIKIDSIQRQGLYAPFTQEGTLVVDGIAASSYISLQKPGHNDVQLANGVSLGISQHDYVHMGLAPLRLLCLGVSGRYCQTDYYTQKEGMPVWAAFSVWLNEWINTDGAQSTILQLVAYAAIAIVSGFCLVAEKVFGAAHAPLALLGIALAVTVQYRRRRQQQPKLVYTVRNDDNTQN